MSANVRVIRAERYAEMGTILQRDASVIVERWAQRAAEEQPTAARVHRAVLLDHLPQFLQELAVGLADTSPDHRPHHRPALLHGEQRWEEGWSLGEVVHDFLLLRLIVLEHLDETLGRALRLREAQAVGLALDEAIEASVAQYTRNRDEHTRQMEESLRGQAEALRAADRRKNEFLAVLAHELRNPLAPLRNSLEVARLASHSPETLAQAHGVMDRQVRQMTRLVDDLLDLSRVSQGKLALQKARIDVRQAVEQAVQTNAPLVESRRQQLTVSLPPLPVWVEGDPTRLVQVAVNLINNAAKYTPEGGTIAVAVTAQGGEAVLAVHDNGVGIPAEHLGQVFDLFAQLDAHMGQGGLGIGLALVRQLVEMHGGSVTAASEGPGTGSEFVVRLPALSDPAPASAPAPAEQATRPTRHVLIIEDNADGRDSLAALLRLMGHRVDVVGDGPGGLQAVVDLKPEVALIDIGLPGLDGYELARQARARVGPAVMLVALTGYAAEEDRKRALECGFNAHLTKPVEPEALQALLTISASGPVAP